MQLDEGTGSNKDARLICCLDSRTDSHDIVEDLFCKSIIASKIVQVTFETQDTFIVENNVEWTKCFDFCTDGGRSMSGVMDGCRCLFEVKPGGGTRHLFLSNFHRCSVPSGCHFGPQHFDQKIEDQR